jgi:hypothetical protein
LSSHTVKVCDKENDQRQFLFFTLRFFGVIKVESVFLLPFTATEVRHFIVQRYMSCAAELRDPSFAPSRVRSADEVILNAGDQTLIETPSEFGDTFPAHGSIFTATLRPAQNIRSWLDSIDHAEISALADHMFRWQKLIVRTISHLNNTYKLLCSVLCKLITFFLGAVLCVKYRGYSSGYEIGLSYVQPL